MPADGHGHAHHHAVDADADARRLGLALALILGLMAVEVAVGLAASSLALLSDAAHLLTDAAALALSLVAARLALRPARGAMTFGLRRAEVLSAQVNGLSLGLLAILVVIEAIRRLIDPSAVDAVPVLVVALVGAAVNVVAAKVIAGSQRRSLNVEGSLKHIVTDLYAFLGTAIAAVVILLTGVDRADPIASLLVAGLMLHASYGLLTASGRVFLEAAPAGLDPTDVGHALVAVPGVVEVHDLHVWEVTTGFPALSAHVLVGPDTDCHAVRLALETVLHDRFALHHTTLQVDHERDTLLGIAVPERL